MSNLHNRSTVNGDRIIHIDNMSEHTHSVLDVRDFGTLSYKNLGESGGIYAEKMYDGNGNTYTLEELRQRWLSKFNPVMEGTLEIDDIDENNELALLNKERVDVILEERLIAYGTNPIPDLVELSTYTLEDSLVITDFNGRIDRSWFDIDNIEEEYRPTLKGRTSLNQNTVEYYVITNFNAGSNYNVSFDDNKISGLVRSNRIEVSTEEFSESDNETISMTLEKDGREFNYPINLEFYPTVTYVGYSDGMIASIDDEGDERWTYTVDAETTDSIEITALDVDVGHNVYAAIEDIGTIIKLDDNGDIEWSWFGILTDSILSLVVDLEGNVYAGDASGTVYSFNSDGEPRWEQLIASNTDSITNLSLDYQGNIYASTWTGQSVVKMSSNSGSTVWEYELDENSWGVEVDDFGIVYASLNNRTIEKISPDGEFLNNYNLGGSGFGTEPRMFAVDDEENIYVYSSDPSDKIVKIDSDGNEVWEYTDVSGGIWAIYRTADNRIVFDNPSEDSIVCLDSDGNEIWTYQGSFESVRSMVSAPKVLRKELEFVEPEFQQFVFTGHASSSADQDFTVRKINADTEDEVWEFTAHSANVNEIAVDSNENVYSASSDNTVRRIDISGNELWSFTGHSSTVDSIAVDIEGNIYSGSFDNTVKKLDSNGNELWTFTEHSGNVRAIAVDQDKNVYSAGNDETVRKIDSDGNQIWSFTNHSNTVYGLAVDLDGNVHSGAWDDTVRKIDSDGNEIWSWTSPLSSSFIRDIAVSNDGTVLIAEASGNLFKLDSTGDDRWHVTGLDGSLYSVSVDQEQNVYAATSSGFVYKLDEDGNEVWAIEYPFRVESVAVNPGTYGAGFWNF